MQSDVLLIYEPTTVNDIVKCVLGQVYGLVTECNELQRFFKKVDLTSLCHLAKALQRVGTY